VLVARVQPLRGAKRLAALLEAARLERARAQAVPPGTCCLMTCCTCASAHSRFNACVVEANITPFEAQRLRNIAANQTEMQLLGLSVGGRLRLWLLLPPLRQLG
jgi:hypothetical protein